MVRKKIVIAAALVVAVFSASSAFADPYSLGAIATGNFAIYGFGSGFTDQLGPGPITVNGNVGVGPGGSANLTGTGININGHLYYSDTPVNGGNFHAANGNDTINGSSCNNQNSCFALVEQNSLATQAKTDEIGVYNSVLGLASNQTVSTLNNFSKNLQNGTPDTYVVDVTGNTSLSAGNTINLNGDSSDFFIFRILGGFGGSAGGSITATNLSPDHVLFDFLCDTTVVGVCNATAGAGSSDINFSGSFVGKGVVLALERNITQDTPGGSWTGKYLSDSNKTITLFSEATITAPEPGSLIGIGLGLLALVGFSRKKRT